MQINELASRLEPYFYGSVFAAGACFLMYWHYRRARAILDDWAARYGYRVLDASLCLFPPLAFWFSNRNQVIYSVRVESAAGAVRRGWVRCGSFWFGIWENTADVVWTD